MNWRALLFIPPVAVGIAAFVYMTRDDGVPSAPVEEARLAVRVLEVAPQKVQPVATGYGRVEAARTWSAISQVAGRVAFVAEGLAEGAIAEAGQRIVEIDARDYQIAKAKAEANIASAEAQLRELARQEANTAAALELEERTLDVAQSEFDRIDGLVERGTSARAALDAAERALLAQEEAVLTLSNQLALYDPQRETLEASLAVRRAELEEAERALSNTVIEAPFAGRVTEVGVEVGEYVRVGDVLATLEGVEAAEVTAEFQPQAFAPVIRTAFDNGTGGGDAAELSVDATQAVRLLREIGLSARVRLDAGAISAVWPAEIVRFRGATDSATGTLGIVVRVEEPYLAAPGERPPLTNGAFVEVDVMAPPQEGVIAVPRAAVRTGDDGAPFVYVADGEDRLARRPVETGPVIGGGVVIRQGLAAGDRLVLSNPQPPIPGMKLDPVAAE